MKALQNIPSDSIVAIDIETVFPRLGRRYTRRVGIQEQTGR